MLFDLTDLRLFIYIAELKSLTKAAERLHLSLAAASNRVKEMESRFGVRLLYRENKGVQLSPAGETMLVHAQQFMQQVERMKSEMQQYNNGIKGHIRIFANTTAVTEFMPEVLGDFLSHHPHVNVAMEERLNQAIVRAVQEGTADIGIVAGMNPAPGLEFINFSTDHLVLVTRPGHPLAGTGRTSFASTLEFEHIGLHEGSTLQHFLARIVAESGQQLKLRIQVRSFEAMCRMIAANVGIGVLPQSAATRYAELMDLEIVELAEPWAARERCVVVQELETLPQYARELVDFICTRAGKPAVKGEAA
jgi:DNA-binding transcriptional LysR family regulator